MAEIYTYKQQSPTEYTFTSVGPKGSIKKVVSIEEIEGAEGFYNVLLESEIDGERKGDQERTNNGDPLKVINTVAAIVVEELTKHPEKTIYIAGSDGQRNAAYLRRVLQGQPGIEVQGSKTLEGPFDPLIKGETYAAFLVVRS